MICLFNFPYPAIFTYKNLLYLLLNSCDGNDAKQGVFLGRLLVALKRTGCVTVALKRAGFSLADVQSDVILPSCLRVATFFIHQLLCRRHFVTCVNEALLQVAGHSGWCRGQVFVQCTHVPASVQKFCSQPGCLIDTGPAR